METSMARVGSTMHSLLYILSSMDHGQNAWKTLCIGKCLGADDKQEAANGSAPFAVLEIRTA